MIKFNHDFSSRFRILKGGKISLVVSAMLGSAIIASASPTQGVVTSGTAIISQSGNTTNINQSTQKASINWKDFSIKSNEVVNFNQPNQNSITLNRVVGNEKSVIDGALNANGQVWILNSNGILFNKNAKVNTAGLVATTKELSDKDFQAGNYNFKGDSTNSVINLGTIEVTNNSYVVLASNEVKNSGTIKAIKGKVYLSGASEYTVNLNGNSIVDLVVSKGVLDAMVENSGSIIANGGEIYLTTNAVNELLKGVVNNTGVIEANSLDDISGKVELVANNGDVINSGTIDVSSNSAKAGKVIVTGKNTTITQTASIKADGKIGGGTIYVGGSWQNSDKSVSQATKTIVEKNAKITANATDNGDGGTIAIWSDVTKSNSLTKVAATLEAKAGKNGGNGGKIETSGYTLDTENISVTAAAPKGKGGLWLLDPTDTTITQSVANSYVSTLNGGTSVENIVSGSMTISNGVIISKTSGNEVTLKLQSTGSGYIYIGSGVQISDTASSILNFTIETAGPVYFENNGSSNQTINIHGDLDIGAASNGYSVGNAYSYGDTYKNGVYIGNYNNFTADNINIRGKGYDYNISYYNGASRLGGEGILVGSNTNILSLTDINLKGQGGAGSNASDAVHAENDVVISGSTGTNWNTSAGNASGGTYTQPSAVSSGVGTSITGTSGNPSIGGIGYTGSNGDSASNTSAAGGNGVSISSSTTIKAGRDLTVIGIGGQGGNGGRGGNGGMGDTGGTAQNGQGGGNASGGDTSYYDTTYPYASYQYNSAGGQYYADANGTVANPPYTGYYYYGTDYSRPYYVYYSGGNGTGGAGGNSIGGTGGTGGTGGNGSAGASGGIGIKVTSATLEARRDLKLEATGGAGGTGGSGGTGGTGGTGGSYGIAGQGGYGAAGCNTAGGYCGTGYNGSSGSAHMGDGGTGGTGGTGGAGGNSGYAISLESATSIHADENITFDTTRGAAGYGGNTGYGGTGGTGWNNGSSGSSGSSWGSGYVYAGIYTNGAAVIGDTNSSGGTYTGNINLIADAISLNTSTTIKSLGGILNIKAKTDGTSIGIGSYGTLNLSSNFFWNGTSGIAKDGFSVINIGSADLSNPISISGNVTATDNLNFITKSGTYIDLYTGTLTSNDNNITFNGAVRVLGGQDSTISTGSGSGNIVFNDTINGNTTNSGNLTLNTGTGNIDFNGAIGNSTTFANLTITNSALTNFNSTVNIGTNLTQTNAATNTTTFANTVNVGGAATLRGTVFNINNSWNSTGVTSFINSGLITKSQTGDITANGGFSTSGDINLASNISTTNTNLSIGGNLTIAEGKSVLLSTSTGAGNITVSGQTQGTSGGTNEALALTAGAGNITFSDLVGRKEDFDLTTLTINSVATATFDKKVDLKGTFSQIAGSVATTFNDEVDVGTLTLSGTAFNFNNNLNSDSTITITNSGLVTKSNVGNITSTGAFSTSGALTLGSDLTTATGSISVGGALTLSVPSDGANGIVTILANDRASNITINSITGANQNLELISGSGNITVTNNATGLNKLILQEDAETSTGSVTLNGNVGVVDFKTYARSYDVSLLGSSNTFTNQTTFLNKGNLVLGNATADTFNFTNGLNTVAASTDTNKKVQLFSTINTTNSDIVTDDVTLNGNTIISTNSGIGNIDFQGTVDGTYDLTLSAGTGNVTFEDKVGETNRLANLVINSATKTDFNDSVKVASASLTGGIFNLNNTWDSTTSTAFTNSGLITVNQNSDITTGTTFSITGDISLNSNITTTNNNLTIGGNLNLLANTVTLSTGTGVGNISLNSATGNNKNLKLISGQGSITSSGSISGIDTLSIQEGITTTPGSVVFNGNLSVNTLSTQASNYDISLYGTNTTIQNAITFNNTGNLNLGNGSDTINFVNGLNTDNPSLVNINGTIQSEGTSVISLGDSNTAVKILGNSIIGGTSTGNIDISAVTLSDGATLTLGTGINNDIAVDSITGTASGAVSNLGINSIGNVSIGNIGTDIGTITITKSADTTFTGTVNTNNLTILNGTENKTIAFDGNLTVNTAMSASAGSSNYNIALLGSSNSIAGNTTLSNTGNLTLGDSSTDTTTFTNGLTATSQNSINLFGETKSTTSAATITLGNSELLGTSKLTTNNGNINLNGRLNGRLNGANNITLTAGTGNININNTIGDTARLGALTIASATTTNIASDIKAALTSITSGTININSGDNSVDTTSTQSYNGAVVLGQNTTLTGSDVTFGGTLNSSNTAGISDYRTLSINGNGIFNGIVGATYALGSLDVSGTTAINSASIRTKDNQTYNGVTTLGADTTLSTTNNGTIWFKDNLDSTTSVRNLTINNGNGNVIFDGTTGNTLALGTVGITSNNVTINKAFNSGAMSVTNSGLFTTSSEGDINVSGGFTQNGVGNNSLAGDITTVNNNISFAKAVVLTDDVVMSTGSSAGNISFAQTIDGTTPSTETLTLTAGTGNVVFTGLVGNTTELCDIIINSATNVTTNGIKAASFEQKAGTGTTTVNLGTFSDVGQQSLYTSATKGIDITTSTISFTGAIQTVNNGNLRLKANNNLSLTQTATADGSGNVNLEAGGLLTIGALVSTGTGNITLIGGTGVTHTGSSGGLRTTENGEISVTATTGNITMADGTVYEVDDGDVTLLAANNILLGEIKAQKVVGGNTVDGDSLIRVTATNGNITDNTASSNPNIIGRVAALNGKTGVGASNKYIQTQVKELSLNANTGGIYVNSYGDVAFGSADGGVTGTTTSGDIVVTATGTITTAGEVVTKGAITLDNLTATGSEGIVLNDNITADGLVTFKTHGDFSMLGEADIFAKGGFSILADGDTKLAGKIRTNNSDITFNSKFYLVGDLTLDTNTGAGNISLQEVENDATALGSPHSLTLAAGTGNVIFNKTLGVDALTGKLDELKITSANSVTLDKDHQVNSIDWTATNINLNRANYVTTGSQSYNGAVVLGQNTTLTGSDVTFGGTLNSSNTAGISDYRTLSINGNGIFNGIVGATYALGSLDVSGTTAINSTSVRTKDNQTYNGVTTLGANTTLSTINNGTIWFKDNLDSTTSARNLTINNGNGNVIFDGTTGNTLALGTVGITGNNVTINKAFNSGAMSVTNSGLFTTSSEGDINASGGFTQNGVGTNSLAGDITTVNNNISFVKAVVLTDDVVMSTGSGAGNISFADTVNSDDVSTPRDLTLSTGTGTNSFGGAVGNTAALDELIINSSNILDLNQSIKSSKLKANSDLITLGSNADIQTSGIQNYNGAVVLNANTTLTGSKITFENTVDSDNIGGATPISNYRFLDIVGDVVFNGAVGSNYELGTLSVSGDSEINGGVVKTNGTQTYTGAVTLGNDTSFVTNNSDITFGSSIDAKAGVTPAPNLSFTAGNGDISVSGAIGSNSALGDIEIVSAKDVTTNGITADNFTQLSGTGTSTFNGTTDLTGNFDFTGTNLTVNAPMNIDGSAEITNSGLFTTSSNGDILAKDGFVQNGTGDNSLAGDITTDGNNISFAGNVTLTDDITISTGTGPGDVTFAKEVNSDGSTPANGLTINALDGVVKFDEAIGGTSPLGNFSVTSNEFLFNDLTSTSNVDINVQGDFESGNITAGGDMSISTTGDITQKSGSNLVITGDSTFEAVGGDLILTEAGNSFTGQVNMTAQDIQIDYAGGDFTVGNVSSTNLDITSTTGDITQASGTSIIVTNETTLASTSGDITLSGENDFQGTVNASGANVALNDVNGIELGTISASESLGVSATDDITQSSSSVITSNGETTLSSTTGDVTLDGRTNQFKGKINLNAKNAKINATSKLNLGDIKLNTKLQGTGAPNDTLNASDISNIITKDFSNVEKNIKIVTDNLKNLFSNKLENNNLTASIIERLNFPNTNNISLVSIPPEKIEVEKITFSELVLMNEKSQNKDVNSDIIIALAENSAIKLINSGVNLPEGVEQEFYVIKQDKDNKGIN